MGAKKTWFIPPDFTFLPDGQISLGSIIPGPWNPTITLASLADEKTIVLPNIKSIIERNHSFSANTSHSTQLEAFVKLLELVSGRAKLDVSWYTNKSFGSVDHEVRQYNGRFTPESLKEIMELDGVKEHINRRCGRKRSIYVITGLRVTLKSFTVTDEEGKNAMASLKGSGSVPHNTTPVQLGGAISGSTEDKSRDGYNTAKGIVFAYRLHVIRPRGTGGQAEVFSDSTAFCTGEGGDEQSQEMEVFEVSSEELLEDLNLDPEDYEVTEGQDESYAVFTGAT